MQEKRKSLVTEIPVNFLIKAPQKKLLRSAFGTLFELEKTNFAGSALTLEWCLEDSKLHTK